MTAPTRPTLLIDASSLAYRAYHAMPPVHAPDGTLVNAAVGQRFDGAVEVVSGDRDLFTLVRDPRVLVLYTLRGVSELAHVDQAWIAAKYGIPGDRYLDYAIMRGDPSDGLPGVRGIGEKSAAELLRKYGSLDGILAATDLSSGMRAKLAAGKDYITAARRVVGAVFDCQVGDVDATIPRVPSDRIVELAERYGI